MEISHVLIDAIWRPHFVFRYATLHANLRMSKSHPENLPWKTSTLNPKNRINSLGETKAWRVDGATICGTTFFVVPTSLLPHIVPLRVDLYIPDQNTYPLNLHQPLDASLSAPLRDLSMISRLGISRHICAALESHVNTHPKFYEEYTRLPFGSRLLFNQIEANVNNMKLRILPSWEVERQSMSVLALRKLWERDIPQEAWPETVALECLRLVKQIHDSVSIVSLTSAPGDLYAFKSTVDNLEFLYHELKFLLNIPQHPNVMPRPLYVVTKRGTFGGKHGVVGFLLPYYSLGSIRDLLPARSRKNAISLREKTNWCMQVTSALLHVLEHGGEFYSDLRPDNVLLASDNATEGLSSERVVLCDFEQRGNWHEWCAPEVLYRQYAVNIQLASRDTEIPYRWQRLIHAYMCNAKAPSNAIEAKNMAWFNLSSASQEKAMVYSLGLFIYCVFEGISNVRVNIANAYRLDPDVEFPTFRRTPAAVQKLIRQCTVDAPEWPENREALLPVRAKRVVRIKDKLYGARYQDGDSQVDIEDDVLQTGLIWWETELERAESFLQTEAWRNQDFGRERPALHMVLSSLKDLSVLQRSCTR